MKLIKLSDLTTEEFSLQAAAAAAKLAERGTVIMVPTETVYGLVCRWDDEAAVEKIYELKHRESAKKLALFTDDLEKLAQTNLILNDEIKILAAEFCPGPITLIGADDSGDTIGFRIPDHRFVLEVLKHTGFPLASTSANGSGMPNALTAEMALAELDGEVDLAYDGGDLPEDAQASTVVLCVDSEFKILRPGPISEDEIRSVVSRNKSTESIN